MPPLQLHARTYILHKNRIKRERMQGCQASILQLFSTNIVAGEFDPTADVLPQLQALDQQQARGARWHCQRSSPKSREFDLRFVLCDALYL
jgi:hypothetical protein